jgi:hypothetical protein
LPHRYRPLVRPVPTPGNLQRALRGDVSPLLSAPKTLFSLAFRIPDGKICRTGSAGLVIHRNITTCRICSAFLLDLCLRGDLDVSNGFELDQAPVFALVTSHQEQAREGAFDPLVECPSSALFDRALKCL